MEKTQEKLKDGPMVLSVEIAGEPLFKPGDLWAVIFRLGKFRKGEGSLSDNWVKVDVWKRLTHQARYKRYLVFFEAKHKNGATLTFICHPRHEPLLEGLKKFFGRHNLKLRVLSGGKSHSAPPAKDSVILGESALADSKLAQPQASPTGLPEVAAPSEPLPERAGGRDGIPVDLLGKCEYCGKLVVCAEDLSSLRRTDRCPHCKEVLTYVSFGFEPDGASFKKVWWIGPNEDWIKVRPGKNFVLKQKRWRVSVGAKQNEPELVEIVSRGQAPQTNLPCVRVGLRARQALISAGKEKI